MEELELIKRCQEGELENFSDIYDLYIDPIYKFIYLKVSDRSTAEDLTSEVFISVLYGIQGFSLDQGSSFKSWVYRIAYNKVIDYYRTKKTESSIDEIGEVGTDEDIGKKIDDTDKLGEVLGFLQNFKEDQRDIIVLRLWDDLSYKEIATVTGKSIDNCKQIVSRGLKQISANFALLLIFIFLL